jgi:hypothetical protein
MQKYKPSPKAKAKAKTMAKAMPKATMPKAKAVAKPKPTAQSVAKQRAEMLKKLSPAMREMKMGSKMVKCEDGTRKVGSMGKSEGRVANPRNGNAVRIEMKTVKPMAIVETKKVSTKTGKSIKGTEKKKPMFGTEISSERFFGSKMADGTGKVKAPSTAARRDNTAATKTRRSDLLLNEKESEYYTLQEKRKKLPVKTGETISEMTYAVNNNIENPNYITPKTRKETIKLWTDEYKMREKKEDSTLSNQQNALGTRFKKRNEAMDKLAGKMSYGTKSVSKMKMGSKKVC